MAAKKKTVPSVSPSDAAKVDDGAGSRKYPRHSVDKAMRIPKALLVQNAGKPATVVEAAGFVGVGASGEFRLEVSSAKKYGFLASLVDGRLGLTDRARAILRPTAEGDDKRAYREAVMAAPQLSDVYKHYRGENLPDDTFFRNTVIDKYSVPAAKFDDFREIFLESLKVAGLLEKIGDQTRVLDASEEGRKPDEKSDLTKKLERKVKVEPTDTCFVMQPFSPPLGEYYEKIYKPAIERTGLKPVRADSELFGTGKIMEQVWGGIRAAKVLVAELTTRNPNVFYELGLAHALQKPVVLISADQADVPFDLKHIRVIYYDKNDPFWGQKLLDKVTENILYALQNPEDAILKTESLS